MKIPSIILAFGILSLPSLVRADYTPDFAASPYVLDGTVLGVDGWDNRLPTDKDTAESAIIASVSWNKDKPAMALQRANLHNASFPPATGDRVSVAFSVAVEFSGELRKGRQFRIFFGGAPIGEVYFDPDVELGLGYHGGGDGRSGGKICVPNANLVDNSNYNFLFEINAADQTFNLSVTGKKSDGSPLAFTAEGVPFLSPSKGVLSVDRVSILSGPNLNVYLGSLAIETQ